MNKQEKTPFYTKLLEYANSDVASFDVPGHKLGNISNEMIRNNGEMIYKLDANSPRGLDNLNHPNGVIKEAEELCAEAFGADHVFFLVNGCTSAIQVMLMSVIKENDYVLLPRNSHKSVINALIISGSNPIFMEPEYDEEYGFAKNMDYEVVKEAIDNNPFAKAIFLIHPTYFGEVSDLSKIIEYAHSKNMLVLVDEAHGTHFSFCDALPASAISLGADLVATSMHKTGLSLTQSSILMTKGDKINNTEIRTTINILQTTSPSSLLIASLDVARKELYFETQEKLTKILKKVNLFRKKAKETLKNIDVLDTEYFKSHNTYLYDESKLIVSLKKLGISGVKAYKILKDKYNIQAELGERYVVLFIITSATKEEDLDRLYDALLDIDNTYQQKEISEVKVKYHYPKQLLKPRDAYNSIKFDLPLKEALGYISAESIMIYPPGIPLVIPGEQIDQNIIDITTEYMESDCILFKDSDDGMIRVIKMKE